jgi:hypothetical protein
MNRLVRWAVLWLVIALFRLCHSGILWPEETLPMAAAVQILHGRQLYRDVWFDKPPLAPAICLLWGAQTGWPLRLAGSIYILAACLFAGCLARALWGAREGRIAAALLAFYLTFWLPAAVIPLASDLLMLAPHAAAIWLAVKRRGFAAGIAAGLAFQSNPKGLFVLAACLVFHPRGAGRMLAGFAIPSVLVVAWLGVRGALPDYYRQVWQLGATYARDSFLEAPLREGLARTAAWAGFHAALIVGAFIFWRRERGALALRLALWTALALAGVCLGLRFFPRYYFLLLLPLTVAAARGLALSPRRYLALAAIAILVPVVRFGPRYVLLASDLVAGRPHAWRDLALDADSREAARRLRASAKAGETLLVWGYRPELYVYTRLPAASRFLESQPLTGVFADRHLFDTRVSDAELARRSRRELIQTRPDWVVDGLSVINPALNMDVYVELRDWLGSYRLETATRLTRIYRRAAR